MDYSNIPAPCRMKSMKFDERSVKKPWLRGTSAPNSPHRDTSVSYPFTSRHICCHRRHSIVGRLPIPRSEDTILGKMLLIIPIYRKSGTRSDIQVHTSPRLSGSTWTNRKVSRCGSADGGSVKGPDGYEGMPHGERSRISGRDGEHGQIWVEPINPVQCPQTWERDDTRHT